MANNLWELCARLVAKESLVRDKLSKAARGQTPLYQSSQAQKTIDKKKLGLSRLVAAFSWEKAMTFGQVSTFKSNLLEDNDFEILGTRYMNRA